jgi:hypothetical protein
LPNRVIQVFIGFILQAIEEPFLMAVKDTLGDRYTPVLDRLYQKTIHFLISMLVVGFRQGLAAMGQTSIHQPTTSTEVVQLSQTAHTSSDLTGVPSRSEVIKGKDCHAPPNAYFDRTALPGQILHV